MQVDLYDTLDFSRLDMVYNQMRVLQAKHNETQYGCVGSGKCCKVGLRIPILECAYIAFRLRQEYYLKVENLGQDEAEVWWGAVIGSIKVAFRDETWQPDGQSEKHCVFFSKEKGCTIYGFRPFICRAYGVVSTVDDFCPRKRMEDGNVAFFAGDSVKKVVQEFVDAYNAYANRTDQHMVVFMPLGILNFLLPSKEMEELKAVTDEKFWTVAEKYRMHFIKSILGEDYE